MWDLGRIDPIVSEVHSRRGALVRVGAVFLGLAAAPDLARAKKGKRKRRCKPVNQPENVPTCEEHCFPEFPFCYTRTAGPPLCANAANEGGDTPCAIDQECLGDPGKPYCLVTVTNRDTGSTQRFIACEPYPTGCCISVQVL